MALFYSMPISKIEKFYFFVSYFYSFIEILVISKMKNFIFISNSNNPSIFPVKVSVNRIVEENFFKLFLSNHVKPFNHRLSIIIGLCQEVIEFSFRSAKPRHNLMVQYQQNIINKAIAI